MSQIKPYVLVVEEVKALQHVILQALRHRGVPARGVARCEDVARYLEARERPGVLLVSCPGVALCPLRRGDPRFSSLVEVAVVAMSASGQEPGCPCVQASLQKPFGVGQLVATLRQACGA